MITELIFPGNVPGNNGKTGLLRMGWRKRKKLKESYFYHIRTMTTNQHTGQVAVEVVRHSIGPEMDTDNLTSTCKLIFDALKMAKVIVDDKPSVIGQPRFSQTKALSLRSQMTVIRIVDLPAAPVAQ